MNYVGVKRGDLVRLKSGGPVMVVRRVEPPRKKSSMMGMVYEGINCEWISVQEKYQHAWFYPEQLKEVP